MTSCNLCLNVLRCQCKWYGYESAKRWNKHTLLAKNRQNEVLLACAMLLQALWGMDQDCPTIEQQLWSRTTSRMCPPRVNHWKIAKWWTNYCKLLDNSFDHTTRLSSTTCQDIAILSIRGQRPNRKESWRACSISGEGMENQTCINVGMPGHPDKGIEKHTYNKLQLRMKRSSRMQPSRLIAVILL